MTARLLWLSFFLAAVALGSCDKGSFLSPEDLPSTTFETIQKVVLDQNCSTSGCHSANDRAGDLILEKGYSYGNIVNVEPANTFARTAKYFRIRPFKPDSSFLFLKIDQTLDVDFGNRMPSNSTTPLPSNYREFVRQWIIAGAPQEGQAADERLIADPIVNNDTFTPLEPPLQGIQLHLRPFAINPSSEREIFVFDGIATADSMFVNRVEVKMRPNSHHFILYKYSGSDLPRGQLRDLTPTSIGQEIFRPSRQIFVGSQAPSLDYELPPNVVLPLGSFQGFDFNSHYVNKTQAVSTGEVFINLHTTVRNDSSKIGLPIFDNYFPFVLPRGQRTTITKTWTKSFPQEVFMLSSHTHKRGEAFRIFRVGGPDDGKLVYENHDWDHPPAKTFSPPLHFDTGWGYRAEVTYNNETDRDILFGVTSEDEMCIVVGYYYR